MDQNNDNATPDLSIKSTKSNLNFLEIHTFEETSTPGNKPQLTITENVELLNIEPNFVWRNPIEEEMSISTSEKTEEEMWEQYSQTESSCIPQNLNINLPELAKRDPYVILNSLTSQQIRRLISTSYNSSKKFVEITAKRKNVDYEMPSTSSTKSKRFRGSNKTKKNKSNAKSAALKMKQEVVVERLSTPTHASLVRVRIICKVFILNL